MSSGKTTRAQVPYPLSSDTANVASDIQAVASFIDTNIPLWATTTTGSAPTPSVNSTGGEFWWCSLATSSNYGLNYYNGTSWVNLGADSVYVGTTAPAVAFPSQVWINTTYTNPSISYYNGSAWVSVITGTSTSGLVLTSGASGSTYQSVPSSAAATTSTQGIVQLAGDLAGTASAPTVTSVAHVTTGTLPAANGGTGASVTTPTGTGANVLATSPTLVGPNLGTPSSATLTYAIGLPLTTGVTGTLPVANGGTNATTAAAALTNLGAMAANVTALPSVTSVNNTFVPSSQTLLYSGGPAGTPSAIDLTNATKILNTNPAGRIYTANSTSKTTVPSTTNTAIVFDTISGTGTFLENGITVYSVSGTTYGLTVPSAGWYQVSGSAFYNATSSGIFQLQIWVGSVSGTSPSGTQWGTSQSPANTLGTAVSLSDTVYANAGDAIFIAARQNSGSTQTTTIGNGLTYLAVSLVSQ